MKKRNRRSSSGEDSIRGGESSSEKIRGNISFVGREKGSVDGLSYICNSERFIRGKMVLIIIFILNRNVGKVWENGEKRKENSLVLRW